MSDSLVMQDRVFQSTPSAWRETFFQLFPVPEPLNFNPLPPHGGRRFTQQLLLTISHEFQSTPSAWRETNFVRANCCHNVISIHSLRMEGDVHRPGIFAAGRCNFNPLPPHGGRRNTISPIYGNYTFQSTPSAWRETAAAEVQEREEEISIHSLRMEGDINRTSISSLSGSFQSTPSAWRETLSCLSSRCGSQFQSTPSAWRET